MIVASNRIQKYFDEMERRVKEAHTRATAARAQGIDPVSEVEIKLAKNMAERVVGLISVLAPQIVNSGVVERIVELEQQYGLLDWRVALKIAEEIAQQKYCTFKDSLEAMDIAIRTGFAYVTVGVVSSPLDGIVSISLKDRMDGKGQYLCLSYAGPIRNAGGTAAAVSVLIADYVRKCMGYATYDATLDETKRASVELQDYHDRVTNLQYHPSESELNMLLPHLPVEVSGEPSEKFEVSLCKDLPRISTNIIRSGYCLVLSSCIPLKAPKLWKKLSVWGKDMDMEHWNFLEQFLKIQKQAKAKSRVAKKRKANESKLQPDYTYIKDLVAGRPILGHPLEQGGFRLRYGRSRASGLSGQCTHPATMQVLDDYIAVGTQLKVGRPGKGATYTPCDTIEGPIVKLESGDVVYLNDEKRARSLRKEIAEILFLGDVLVDVGDFINRAHMLIPVGYCEEWWSAELKHANKTVHDEIMSKERRSELINRPFVAKPSFQEAVHLSEQYEIPLHPAYTYHWRAPHVLQRKAMVKALRKATYHTDNGRVVKAVVPYNDDAKRGFEVSGVPHRFVNNEFLVFEDDVAAVVQYTFMDLEALVPYLEENTLLEALQACGKRLRDKSGTFIGSRMGRPEKAKMRKMTGSPHGLFAVGDEGGRLRSLQEALNVGSITADFPNYHCDLCGAESAYSVCPYCDKPARRQYYCRSCKTFIDTTECPTHGKASLYSRRTLPIADYVKHAQKKTQLRGFPDLVKGVRGTSNEDHIQEPLAKALLRSKHHVYVNKDGTVRFDASELTLTHVKPCEIQTTAERLRSLGYDVDVAGEPLTRDDQIVELFPQDVVLPGCTVAPQEPADKVLLRIAQFIDDELVSVYGLEPYFNVKSRDDLIGHLIIGLAPHTSAGLACRIVGFSKTQGFFANPYVHQACRRDCDGDELGFMLLMDGFLNFSRKFLPQSRGGTMDAPLVLTSVLNPTEVDDQAFDVCIESEYPLELYTAALQFTMPWDIKLKTISDVLGKPEQFEGLGYTHDLTDINAGVLCSAYKLLPSMEEKLAGQMELAKKIRAVYTGDVAERVIQKHFIKDTKGNLRKFSQQQFRCVACNEKYRRPPLLGTCTRCKRGRIIFTISQGSILKYLQPTIDLANTYEVSPYLKQTVEILKRVTESVFGREKEKQTGLGSFF